MAAQGFTIIPRWLLYREGLSKHAKLVYAVIASHVNGKGEAWPSQALIAREGSMSISSAQRGIAELVALGVVESRPKPRSSGAKGVNVYALLLVDEPVDNSSTSG